MLHFYMETMKNNGTVGMELIKVAMIRQPGNIVHERQPSHLAGDFVQAILRKDFYRAFQHADSVNLICMHIYACWAYNKLPI